MPLHDVIAHNPRNYVQQERATKETIVASKVTLRDPTLVHAFREGHVEFFFG